LPPADEAAAEGEEGFVDVSAAVVPNEQPLELVQPGEGAFDDPAVRPRPEPSSVARRAMTGLIPRWRSWRRWLL
jgi:hypothetical protein